MKVLVLTTTFPRWQEDTVPAFVYQLCQELLRNGLEIVVLAPHHQGAPLQEEMAGLKVHRFAYFYPKRYQRLYYEGGVLSNLKRSRLAWVQVPLLVVSELYHALRLIKKEKVDIIHSHWLIPSGLVGAICKKVCKRPLVVTIHGSDIFPFRKGSLKHLLRLVLKSCDACTANSQATASAAQEITDVQQKLAVIPMGVDLNRFHPDEPGFATDKPLILSVGRLINWKGVDYLIRAMPLVLEQLPEARLVICGDGPERANLERLASELSLTGNVVFEGSVPNSRLPDYYRTASVFVLPSIVIESTGETEALGVVLLEAMACGKPVIGSNVGGIPDIIEDGWNGFLVQQKSPEELADRIVRLLSSDELRHRFSENALQTVRERFSWEAVTDRFGEIYERLR